MAVYLIACSIPSIEDGATYGDALRQFRLKTRLKKLAYQEKNKKP